MTALIHTLSEKLGGAETLGRPVRSMADLAMLVHARLPLGVLKLVSAAGISEQEINRFIIPARTRRHRAARNEDLTLEESDRTIRILRIQTIAEETFADTSKAATWLRHPLHELGGKTPIDVAQSEAGARLIETILGKISWGAAA